jgi:probable F420-dependent oxidoreductase
VKVYAGMDPALGLPETIEHARRVERLGYDGLHVAETIHDSLAVSLLLADHTERITIRSAVTLAFVRSPTLVAYSAWDLAKHSGGRFQLGLGTQIRQNITGRYGMPWHEPVETLRDYLGALDALYESFASGKHLQFQSDHYSLTRLQPYFNPGPDARTSPPPTYLGGVNPKICQLAGEKAAGFITHPTNSNPRYLETLCLPNLEIGLQRAGRERSDLELVIGTQVITGVDARALDEERERQRRLFAFLYSTPAYRRTLELYGWPELADRLAHLIREQRWDDLPSVVSDEILDTLIPSAPFDGLAALLHDRFGHLGDGILVSPPGDPTHDRAFADVISALRAS